MGRTKQLDVTLKGMLEILLSQSILAEKDRIITDGKCTVSGRKIMANTIKYKFISLAQEQNLKNQTTRLQSKRFKCFRDCNFKASYLYQRNDVKSIPCVCLFCDCTRLKKEKQIITLLVKGVGAFDSVDRLDTVAPGSGLVCRYRGNLEQVTLLY